MIEVEGPNGVIVEFPDGTSAAAMSSAMRSRFGGEPKQPDTLAQKAASTGADVLAGVAGWPGSMINLAREYFPGADKFLRPVPGVQDFRNMLADNGPLSVPIAPATSPAGKQVQAALTGAGTGLAFGPLGALAGLYSGLTSETAGQLTEGSAVEPYARLAGALITPGFSASRNMLSKAFSPTTTQAGVATAMRQGPVSVGDVLGGTIPKAIEGNLSRAPFAGSALRSLAERQAGAISSNVDDVAAQMSSNVPRTAREAGEALQGAVSSPGGIGARQIMDRFSRILYNREVYRHVPRDAPVTATASLQAVDDIAARIGNQAVLSTPEWAGLTLVKNMLSGPVNMTNLPSIKQQINGLAETANRAGQGAAASAFRDIYSKLDNDVVNSLQSASPAAAAGYVKANQIQQNIFSLREKLQPYIGANRGDVTAEQAISNLMADVSRGRAGDASTLEALRKALPRSGFDEVRTFVFKNLGVGNDGTLNRAQFVSQWDKITPEARRILFDVKPEQFAAVNRVMNYARSIKPEILNPSGTAASLAEAGGIGATAAAAATGAVNPAVAIGLAFVPKILGNSLASQRVAGVINSSAWRRLMSAPRTTPGQTLIALQTGLREAGATDTEVQEMLNQLNAP